MNGQKIMELWFHTIADYPTEEEAIQECQRLLKQLEQREIDHNGFFRQYVRETNSIKQYHRIEVFEGWLTKEEMTLPHEKDNMERVLPITWSI